MSKNEKMMNRRQLEGWENAAQGLLIAAGVIAVVALVIHGTELVQVANVALHHVSNVTSQVVGGLDQLQAGYNNVQNYDLFTNLLQQTVDTTTAPQMLGNTNHDLIVEVQNLLPMQLFDSIKNLGK